MVERQAGKPPDKQKHLAQVVAWSGNEQVDWVAIVASAIGMVAPMALGALRGQGGLGLTMAVGGLLAGGIGAGRDRAAQWRALLAVLLTAALAALAAGLLAGHGWPSDASMTLLAGAAAVLAAIGRPVAPLAIRFILMMVITFAVAENVPSRGALLVLVAAGAWWTCAVSLVLGALARTKGVSNPAPEHAPPSPRPSLKRWREALKKRTGWQYALRLTLCLAAASLMKALWPGHHMHWVALTVALLAEWQIEPWPVKTTQRALGALFGVLVAGLLLMAPPIWLLTAGVGVLAGLRPWLRARNYLAYTAAMTPLIIVLLDGGAVPGIGVLIDRVVATLIGAALVIATNWLFGKWLGRGARP